MKLLLDTQLILWAISFPGRLPRIACELIEDQANDLYFSAVGIWEIAIKQGLKRSTFTVDARIVRDSLLRNGYQEVALTSHHGLRVLELPLLHQDPFDRILLAQAMSDGMTLVTSDAVLARYAGPIIKV